MLFMYEKIYSQIADALVDSGYIIIENALDAKLATSLTSLISRLENESSFKKAGISTGVNFYLDENRRSDKTKWIDEDSGPQSEYLEFTSGLQSYLNRSLYLGLKYYESHFAIYEEGDLYEKHLDAFKNSKNRVVTTVYYLNENFDKSDGGQLIIYDEDDKEIVRVVPSINTLVVFMSEIFPHEVLSAVKKRYSIAGWYRVD